MGIASTQGMDGIIFGILSDLDLKNAEEALIFGKVLGTVEIEDCRCVQWDKIWDELSNEIKPSDAAFYPYHMIPKCDKVYFWTLSNPSRLKNAIDISPKAMTWSLTEIDDSDLAMQNEDSPFWKNFPFEKWLQLNRSIRNSP